MREAIGAPLPPKERTRYKLEMDRVRAQLGEENFRDEYVKGFSMTVEQAIADALASMDIIYAE